MNQYAGTSHTVSRRVGMGLWLLAALVAYGAGCQNAQGQDFAKSVLEARPRTLSDDLIQTSGSGLDSHDNLFAAASSTMPETASEPGTEKDSTPAPKLVDDLYVEKPSLHDFSEQAPVSWRKPSAKLVDDLLSIEASPAAARHDADAGLLASADTNEPGLAAEPSETRHVADDIDENKSETPGMVSTFQVAMQNDPFTSPAEPVEQIAAANPGEADGQELAMAPFAPDTSAAAKTLPKLQTDLVPYEVFARGPIFETRPLGEFNRFGAPATAINDRGIDSSDVKWRRQARTTGVRMRMLNGPEIAFANDFFRSDYEEGIRGYLGGIMPINNRWEFAALDRLGAFKLRETGERAGIEALTLRVGANPSVSFRPWFSVTPYMGLWKSDAVGVGLATGAQKTIGDVSFTGRAFAFEPWDEGYDTAYNDGRRHGFEFATSIPVDRRLTINAAAGYEWLELGPHAPNGHEYAGRRINWMVRADWILLKRDGAYMGYGFRDPTLWSEQLVPCDFGFFAQVGGERYFRPDGFTTLNPTRRSMSERVGFFLDQAISPHLGINVEGYVGQDPYRQIKRGDLYGLSARLNIVVNEKFRMWAGWSHESSNTTLEAGNGPTRYFSFGFNINF